jgi:hypothetical protein
MYAYRLSINKCFFIKNQAGKISKNIFLGFSNLSISNSQFEDNLLPDHSTLQTEGSFLHIITKVFLNLKSSTFLNGYSKMGGAVALTGCNL